MPRRSARRATKPDVVADETAVSRVAPVAHAGFR